MNFGLASKPNFLICINNKILQKLGNRKWDKRDKLHVDEVTNLFPYNYEVISQAFMILIITWLSLNLVLHALVNTSICIFSFSMIRPPVLVFFNLKSLKELSFKGNSKNLIS